MMEIRMDSAISIPLIVMLTLAKLLAQAGGSPATMGLDASIMGFFGNLGIMGVLVWHMWYHTTKTYPEMLKKFTEEQERIRVAHAKEQKELRDHCEGEMSQLRDMLMQNMVSARSAVHDVRDAVQSVVLKKAVDDRLGGS